MAGSDRSAIGGGGFGTNMDRTIQEVEAVLKKHDWSGITPEQRNQLTSKLYSTVQQNVGDPAEQLNQRT